MCKCVGERRLSASANAWVNGGFYVCKCMGERRLFQVHFGRYDFVTCMYRLCYLSERIIDVFKLRNLYNQCERIVLGVFCKISTLRIYRFARAWRKVNKYCLS